MMQSSDEALILPVTALQRMQSRESLVVELHPRLAKHVRVAFVTAIAVADFMDAPDFVFLGHL